MTETIKGSVVLITGATGAIAQGLIAALTERGATKIYAAARDISSLVASDRLVPIKMDVTSDDDVAKAAKVATDVTLLINNAGVNHNTAFLLAPDLAIAREEIEANYLAPLRVTRAFAPALIENHGAVLNLLTILARVNLPFMGSYCASKAAALSLTQGLRGELAPKGVRIAAAMPGAVDTRMTAVLSIPKMTVAAAAGEILDGFEAGEEDIYVGDMARGLAQGLAHDPKAIERQLASG
jgi:NAD(P)-dependent dehydrogenase (short-subunit alcohol dehydrogenase family)